MHWHASNSQKIRQGHAMFCCRQFYCVRIESHCRHRPIKKRHSHSLCFNYLLQEIEENSIVLKCLYDFTAQPDEDEMSITQGQVKVLHILFRFCQFELVLL